MIKTLLVWQSQGACYYQELIIMVTLAIAIHVTEHVTATIYILCIMKLICMQCKASHYA